MARQIIKQPDGLYAIWSTIVDNFTDLDCTPDEIIELWSREEAARIARAVEKIIRQLNRGEKPYHQFTMTWEEAQAEAKKHTVRGEGV